MGRVEVVDEEEGSADCDLSKTGLREKREGLIGIGSKQKGEVNGTLKREEVDESMKHSFEADALSMDSGVGRVLFAKQNLEQKKNREDDEAVKSHK